MQLSRLEIALRPFFLADSRQPQNIKAMISDDEAREKLVLAADLIADDDSVETSSASASPTGVDAPVAAGHAAVLARSSGKEPASPWTPSSRRRVDGVETTR